MGESAAVVWAMRCIGRGHRLYPIYLYASSHKSQSLGFTGEGRPALTDEEIEFLFSTTDRGARRVFCFNHYIGVPLRGLFVLIDGILPPTI